MLPFVSSQMKNNFEVIHFQMKSRVTQRLVFVQITIEKVPQISIFKTVKFA